jgi:hypothetical protein
MQTVTWHREVSRRVRACPSCNETEWTGSEFGRLVVVRTPNSPTDHPELEHGVDGLAVLPLTCVHCGFVALYALDSLRSSSSWS